MSDENKILYKDLSYKLQGLFFDIRNDIGSGHKESIYQKALEKDLIAAGIKFIKEPSIKIYSKKGEFLGLYRPDFLIEDKIIIELKAVEYVSRQEIARVYDYLRNSEYELAYLVNFASPKLFVKRLIFTNDRKNNPRMATNFKRIATNIIVFVAISVLFVAIRGVSAASFYFTSPTNEIIINQTFKVDLFVDTEDEQINTLGGEIIYPSGLLKLQEVRDGNSIINMWLDNPQIPANLITDGNEVMFSGIIPGGYSGKNGSMFSLIFNPIAEGQGVISIRNAKIFLNDGLGSETQTKVIDFSFVAIRAPIRDDSWVSPKDTEPPESFVPEIVRNETLFEGKWFLVFATQDKISGIDRYFVHETTRKREAIRIDTKKWIMAESPYVLKDQELRSFIYVKAVDKEGNERIAEVGPIYPIRWYDNFSIPAILIIAAVVYLIVKILWTRKFHE